MTYYDILGINRTSNMDEIKRAYRQMIIAFHPDNYRGDKAFAKNKTQEIITAYKVLSDPLKRRDYDLSLKTENDGGDVQKQAAKGTYDDASADNASAPIWRKHSKAILAAGIAALLLAGIFLTWFVIMGITG